MKNYGGYCKELDSDFAAQRIKKLSLFEAIKNALVNDKGAKHKTLVEEFAYPSHGAGLVYNRMAEAIAARGGKVNLNTLVQSVAPIRNDARPVVHWANG